MVTPSRFKTKIRCSRFSRELNGCRVFPQSDDCWSKKVISEEFSKKNGTMMTSSFLVTLF